MDNVSDSTSIRASLATMLVRLEIRHESVNGLYSGENVFTSNGSESRVFVGWVKALRNPPGARVGVTGGFRKARPPYKNNGQAGRPAPTREKRLSVNIREIFPEGPLRENRGKTLQGMRNSGIALSDFTGRSSSRLAKTRKIYSRVQDDQNPFFNVNVASFGMANRWKCCRRSRVRPC